MHLLDIMTENFKRLGNFSASFTDGLNVIAGDNAKGKSTLLQAIEAALFGITVVPGKKENIPTWGQTKALVVLRFKVGADIYKVSRTLTTAKVLRGEDVVANGNTPATLYIEGLLGLQSRDWNLFVQSKQHEASGILTFGATALNRKVEEFAGVDLIDKVQAAAQRQATHLSSVAEAKAVDQDRLEEAQAAVTQAQESRQVVALQLETSTNALDNLAPFSGVKPEQDLADLHAQQRAADRLWSLLEGSNKAVVEAEALTRAAEGRLEGLTRQDASALKDKLLEQKATGTAAGELLTHLQELDKLRALKGSQGVQAYEQVKAARAEVDKLAEGFDPIEAGNLQDQVAALAEGVTKAQTATSEAQAKVRALTDLSEGAACPTCGAAKGEHDPAQLAKELEDAKRELTNARSLQQTATELHNSELESQRLHRKRQDNLDGAKERLARAEAALKAAEEALEATRKIEPAELDAAKESLEKARNAYAETNAALNDVEQSNKRFDAATDDLRRANAKEAEEKAANVELALKWEKLPEPPTDEQVEELKAALDRYTAELNAWEFSKERLRTAVESDKLGMEFAEKVLEGAQKLLTSLLDNQSEAIAAEAKAKKYSRLVQFLRTKRQDYMKEVWDMVMGVASKLVRQSSQGTVTRVANEDGDFYYEEEGNMSPTPSASGAQKAMIGTSLRIALGRALYGSDSLMIFDEPTESCKEHNAASMAATLATSAKQVLLITHRETDQALAENIINVGE